MMPDNAHRLTSPRGLSGCAKAAKPGLDTLEAFWQVAARMSATKNPLSHTRTTSTKPETAGKPLTMDKFNSADIGHPALAGSTRVMSEGLSLTAGGADIWGARDEFRFAYFEQAGDFHMVARIESLTDADLYTKAGLMAREDLTENCRHIFFQVFPNNNPRNHNNGGYEFQYRNAKGAEMRAIYPAKSDGIPEFPANYPNTWIGLQRSGDDFTGFYSADGRTWKTFSTFSMGLAKRVYLGLAVTSHNTKESATAVFRDISSLSIR